MNTKSTWSTRYVLIYGGVSACTYRRMLCLDIYRETDATPLLSRLSTAFAEQITHEHFDGQVYTFLS